MRAVPSDTRADTLPQNVSLQLERYNTRTMDRARIELAARWGIGPHVDTIETAHRSPITRRRRYGNGESPKRCASDEASRVAALEKRARAG